MAVDPKQVLSEALKLPQSARAALAADLIDSLDDDDSADDIETAWADEIQRRLAQVDAGQSKTVPWSVARQRIVAAAGAGDENS